MRGAGTVVMNALGAIGIWTCVGTERLFGLALSGKYIAGLKPKALRERKSRLDAPKLLLKSILCSLELIAQ